MENQIDGKLLPVADGLLEKMKNTLFQEYFPVAKYSEGVIFMSTSEIWQQMQRLYPSGEYFESDVATWMHEKGFQFFDSGKMRFEWMLKPATIL